MILSKSLNTNFCFNIQKCDRVFPRCSKCEGSNVECVGIDTATGRQVPRSYLVHLEDRVAMLESKLLKRGIDPDSSDPDPSGEPLMVKTESSILIPESNVVPTQDMPKTEMMRKVSSATTDSSSRPPQSYIGDSSLGISFAKLMFTAVNFKHPSEKDPSFQPMAESSNLKRKKQAAAPMRIVLPPKQQAETMLKAYFAQSNSQLPILHREQFILKYFEPIYGSLSPGVSLASDCTSMNTHILHRNIPEESTWYYHYKKNGEADMNGDLKKVRTPPQYNTLMFFLNIIFAIASSIHHLQYPATLSEGYRKLAIKHVKLVYASEDRLETLEGLLLLCTYGIMRPSEPGVWYTIGSVLRACVDLGLHSEDSFNNRDVTKDLFTTDRRRRLFWCAYSIDRQVCFYLGRPFGIPEETISARFPSELDDAFIVESSTEKDYSDRPSTNPSYKVVSTAMFQIRKLQLEVQIVLYGNGELPRAFKTLNDWKIDFNRRLNNWKLKAPNDLQKMNCDFNLIFFNLNYNHVRLILHGLSPRILKLSVLDYLAVADASKEVIKSYKTLLELRSINYTWVAVHNLFMAGTSFLYSVYHCEEVSRQTTLDQIKLYTSDCIKVLNSLVDRCDAAIHCRNTFEILAAAVIRLKYDPVFKLPNGSSGKISAPLEQQLGKKHLTTLIEHLGDTRHSPIPREENGNESLFTHIAQPDDNSMKREAADVQIPPPKSEHTVNNHAGSSLKVETAQNNVGEQWLSNSYDLDQFFKELEDMGSFSPTDSTRSNPNSVHLSNRDSSNRPGNSPEQPLTTQLLDVNDEYGNNINNENNIQQEQQYNDNARKLPSTREGQKIYNMIYQVPDEAIWEQFFNTPTYPGPE